jgi:hypothetical protein
MGDETLYCYELILIRFRMAFHFFVFYVFIAFGRQTLVVNTLIDFDCDRDCC